MTAAAAPATGEIPPVLMWGSFAIIVAAMGIPLYMKNRRQQRRIYWTGWALGTLGTAVAVSYRDGLRGFAITLASLALISVIVAVRNGPYLKVGSRIIATSWLDRRPDPTDDLPALLTPMTAETVRNLVFSKPIGRLGYNPQQVDAFVQRVADHLDGHGDLSADEVQSIRFDRPAAFTRGYAPEEVDEFLGTVAETLGKRSTPT